MTHHETQKLKKGDLIIIRNSGREIFATFNGYYKKSNYSDSRIKFKTDAAYPILWHKSQSFSWKTFKRKTAYASEISLPSVTDVAKYRIKSAR